MSDLIVQGGGALLSGNILSGAASGIVNQFGGGAAASALGSAPTDIATIQANSVAAQRRRLDLMRNSLAQKDNHDLSKVTGGTFDFTTLNGDTQQIDAYQNRAQTILTRRLEPGRAQTILANPIQSY